MGKNIDEFKLEMQRKGFTLGPDGEYRKVPKADRVAPDAKRECDPVHEPVAKDARESAYQGRCHVRVTSFRRVLCDERNLFDKHFIDSLVEGGVIRGDSAQEVNVQVSQEKVEYAYQERTEMVITEEPEA